MTDSGLGAKQDLSMKVKSHLEFDAPNLEELIATLASKAERTCGQGTKNGELLESFISTYQTKKHCSHLPSQSSVYKQIIFPDQTTMSQCFVHLPCAGRPFGLKKTQPNHL